MSKIKPRTPLARRLIIAAALAATLLAFFRLLPQGFSDDLSRIGQGTAVAVLLDYRFSVQSQEMMTLINEVRRDYEGKVEFLVVDAESDHGRAFAAEHDASGAILVLFGPQGAPRGVARQIAGERGLREALQAALSSAG